MIVAYLITRDIKSVDTSTNKSAKQAYGTSITWSFRVVCLLKILQYI